MKMNLISRRFATILTTAVVVTLTTAVLSKATQAVSVANSAIVNYNLAAGASTAPITVVANQPVSVMGTQTAVGFRGVASCTLMRVASSFIEWVGLESTAGSAITQGFSGTPGTHILYLDFSHQVDLQVAGTDTMLIHNASTGVRTGQLTLMW
jgi:tRNA(Ile2) C34 agmatinyltransferase TiaS